MLSESGRTLSERQTNSLLQPHEGAEGAHNPVSEWTHSEGRFQEAIELSAMGVSNTEGICACCVTSRWLEWQRANKDTKIVPGDFVKIAFYAPNDGQEHMWVRVNAVNGDKIVGQLDNDPVLIEDLKCGDKVELDRIQIEDLLR